MVSNHGTGTPSPKSRVWRYLAGSLMPRSARFAVTLARSPLRSVETPSPAEP